MHATVRAAWTAGVTPKGMAEVAGKAEVAGNGEADGNGEVDGKTEGKGAYAIAGTTGNGACGSVGIDGPGLALAWLACTWAAEWACALSAAA